MPLCTTIAPYSQHTSYVCYEMLCHIEKLMLAQCEREKMIRSCPSPEAPVCKTKKHGKVDLSTRICGPPSPYSKRHGPSSHSKRHGPSSHSKRHGPSSYSKRQRSHSAPHLKQVPSLLALLSSHSMCLHC